MLQQEIPSEYTHQHLTSVSRYADQRVPAQKYRRARMLCEGSLNACGSHNCIGGAGDEEGIPLSVNFVAVVLDEQLLPQLPAIGQHVGIMLTQSLQQMSRAFYISEEQRHGSSGRSGMNEWLLL